jgi:hypothetical protein
MPTAARKTTEHWGAKHLYRLKPSQEVADMPSENMLLWSESKAQICRLISDRICSLKIILKVKDDPQMLQSWITHHQNIVGLKGLIILDNMSTDPEMLKIYQSLPNEVHKFKYSGFHNNIHYTQHFPEFYRALRDSCEYFTALDTDEHLTLYDGTTQFQADTRVVAFLRDRLEANVYPGTWLQNITGYMDRFSFYDPLVPLTVGLKWGKPIVSTKCAFEGLINHNTQIDCNLYRQPLVVNFFVLHLSRVSNFQRIDANLKKLRIYGEIDNNAGINELREIGLENLRTDQARMYASEIFHLLDPNTPGRGSLAGSIQIRDDGCLIPSEEWQQGALQRFMAEPSAYSSDLFSTS